MRRPAMLGLAAALAVWAMLDLDVAGWTLPLALVLWVYSRPAGGRDPMLDAGLPATATVVSVAPVAEYDAPRVWTLLRVQIDGEDPYETEHVAVGTPETAPEPGESFRVLVDPRDRRRVVHAAVRREPRGGYRSRPADDLSRLNARWRRGELTDEQFAAEVRAVLATWGVG